MNKCEICGNPVTGYRMRKFCSAKCRRRAQTIRYREKKKIWQRKRAEARAKDPSPDKVQCKICGLWYIQVCSHAYLIHGVTEEEYKKEFGLDKGRGVIPNWYKEKKRETNKGVKNLESGAPYRFKPGQEGLGKYERSQQTLARLKQQSFIKKELNNNNT